MRKSLGLIGVGAFGTLAARHLAPHFDLVLYDVLDPSTLAAEVGARCGDLQTAAACDIILLAVPVQKLNDMLMRLAPIIKADALVLDVCSVKIKPVAAMREILPATVSIVGTHPLFGPQSSKNGIKNLNIALCNVRGDAGECVAQFCRQTLGLDTSLVTPEQHDKEAAYVQGLTHMLAKIVVSLDLPQMQCPTRTYELLQQMTEMVRYDSDELFRAIERENPFAKEAKHSFFAAARRLEEQLADHKAGDDI